MGCGASAETAVNDAATRPQQHAPPSPELAPPAQPVPSQPTPPTGEQVASQPPPRPTPSPPRPPEGVVINSPGRWDVFVSHTQRNPNAKLLASELSSSLKERGVTVWLDVRMDDQGEAAMREGVENADLCIAIITDGAGTPEYSYFSREYCLKELRWAKRAGVPIQPVVDIKDKERIGEFIKSAPEDLKFLGGTQFFELYRGNPTLWNACIDNVLRKLQSSSKRKGSVRAPPPASAEEDNNKVSSAGPTQANDNVGIADSYNNGTTRQDQEEEGLIPPIPTTKRTLGQLSSFSRSLSGKKRDSRLVGIDDDEANQLPEIVQQKLESPHLELTVDQRLEVLEKCIEAGRWQATRAKGKQLIMVIGNTGAGKSTACNYLHGCEMESFQLTEEDEDDDDDAVRVREDSSPPELMVIGHSNKSATFMPKIDGGDVDMTFADCPGFLDNRGAEINIANAVNIREAVSQADGIRVLIILNFHSLKADRGKGVRDLAQILIDLFGDAESVQKHAASVVLGLSRAPIFDNKGKKRRLAYFSKLASDTSGLDTDKARVIEMLASRIFVFDPLDRGDDTWLTRDQIFDNLRALPAITEPADVFRTVLTAEDERAIRECVHELEDRLRSSMEDGAYDGVATTLRQISTLEGVNNSLVTALLGRAREQVVTSSMRLKEEVVRSALARNFDFANGHMDELRRASEALDAGGQALQNLARRVGEMVRDAEVTLLRMREDELERSRMYEELRSAHDRQEAMQKQLERLEMQAREDRERAGAQMAELQEAKAASERERDRMAKAFEEQKQKLEQRMAKANEEDARKMQTEIARLEAERKARDQEAQEAFERRERELREQAEESARRAAEAEREKEEMLAKAKESEEAYEWRRRASGGERVEEADYRQQQALAKEQQERLNRQTSPNSSGGGGHLLTNLQTAELNGMKGREDSYAVSKDRYVITLDNGEQKPIKSDNVKLETERNKRDEESQVVMERRENFMREQVEEIHRRAAQAEKERKWLLQLLNRESDAGEKESEQYLEDATNILSMKANSVEEIAQLYRRAAEVEKERNMLMEALKREGAAEKKEIEQFLEDAKNMLSMKANSVEEIEEMRAKAKEVVDKRTRIQEIRKHKEEIDKLMSYIQRHHAKDLSDNFKTGNTVSRRALAELPSINVEQVCAKMSGFVSRCDELFARWSELKSKGLHEENTELVMQKLEENTVQWKEIWEDVQHIVRECNGFGIEPPDNEKLHQVGLDIKVTKVAYFAHHLSARLNEHRKSLLTNPELTLQNIEEDAVRWEEMWKEAQHIVRECDGFRTKPPDIEELRHVGDDIRATRKSWSLLANFILDDKSICEKDWITWRDQLPEIEEFVAKWYTKVKEARQSDAMCADDDPASDLCVAATFVFNQLEDYKSVLPLLKYARGDGWVEENWMNLFKIMNLPTRGEGAVTLETLTVGHFLKSANVLVGEADVLKVLQRLAQGESTIRDALFQLKYWGREASFMLTHSESDVVQPVALVQDWKELMTEISDNQSLVEGLKESEFVKPFRAEIMEWEQCLSTLSKGLYYLSVVQRHHLHLAPIFAQGALPQEEERRFREVDQRYRGIMSSIEQNKNVKNFADIPRVVEDLELMVNQLEVCRKALRSD